MAHVALIDYGAGNLRSVANALEHLGADFEVTADPEVVASAAKVVFPGVGAAASCVRELAARGLVEAIRSQRGRVLGICLGMQVLTESSAEGAEAVPCLGILPGRTERFGTGVKVPQMGWNTVAPRRDDPLFAGIPAGEHFYFLHAYRVRTSPEHVLAETEYDGPYASAVRRANFWGVQFHPEKSGPAGLRLLRNFLDRC
ncbi:MAG: imidazole glycerol phosphate synthase subunit HisH [Gemmatimonadota bacterium]